MHRRCSFDRSRQAFFNYCQTLISPLPSLITNPFDSIIKPVFLLGFNFSSSSSCSSLESLINSATGPKSSPLCNFLHYSQNPNNLVDLICTNLKCNHGLPTTLDAEIKWVIPHLGTHEISRVLFRCQSSPFSALNFFNWVKNDLGFKPSIQNYCIIVHILAFSQEFSLAMKFLVEIVATDECPSSVVLQNLVLCTEDCNWNPMVFDMLVKAYVKIGKVLEGLKSFKEMVKIGFVPDVSASNSLLNGLLKSNCLKDCWEIYNEMGRLGISPNSYTFNILTHVLCKDGDVRKVNEFLEKMEEEGFDPDVVTYNTLINSYCKKGKLDDAFYLYRIMYRRCTPPNLVTYTVLIKGLCKEKKVKEAHQLFHRMVHRGLTPDIVAYNSLISGYCKEGNMQKARSLYQELVSYGLLPNGITCRLLVEGYHKDGRLLSCLNLINELHRLGVSIPPEIYYYLVIALCQENKPYAAMSLFRRMLTSGCQPNLEIYNSLIESFCKTDGSDGLVEALSLKGEMVDDRSLKPDLSTYRSLIRCLCELSKSEMGEAMMKEMVDTGLLPNSEICRALVTGYCKERNLEKAESVLTRFAVEFHIHDTESYNKLFKFYCEESDTMKCLKLQDKLLKLGFVPNSLTCKSLILGLSRAWEDGEDKRRHKKLQAMAGDFCNS